MDVNEPPDGQGLRRQSKAAQEQQSSPGNLVTWDVLRSKELATRCAFCDRAVYPEDACGVKFGPTHGYGCCTHCAMGVAARLQQDIEVEAKDSFNGDRIRVKTMAGQIAAIEPATAVAWFGQKRNSEGQWVSAGCFKQGFFVSQHTLKQWLEKHPALTGREHIDRSGSGGQDETIPGADREGVQVGGMPVTWNNSSPPSAAPSKAPRSSHSARLLFGAS